jgi:hypothetical protein
MPYTVNGEERLFDWAENTISMRIYSELRESRSHYIHAPAG